MYKMLISVRSDILVNSGLSLDKIIKIMETSAFTYMDSAINIFAF